MKTKTSQSKKGKQKISIDQGWATVNAHAAGIDACMCGEMAGEPEYLPVLLGLGFDELSMNAISLLRVKKILRRCSRAEAEKIVARALAFPTAQEVELFVKSEIAAHYSESFD